MYEKIFFQFLLEKKKTIKNIENKTFHLKPFFPVPTLREKLSDYQRRYPTSFVSIYQTLDHVQ